MMIRKMPLLFKPEDDGGSAGGAAAPAPAATAAPSPAPAAPAPAPAASPSPAPAPSPAASSAPAAAPAEAKDGFWPEKWRETVSKDDAKKLSRLQRYASPEAAIDALIAAQNRIAAGELKPVLGKNASPEQIAEYRAAMGIPDDPTKYDLGKDVKIDDAEKPFLEKIFSAAHASNQTPEQVAATVKAYRQVAQEVAEAQAIKDAESREQGADALRAEWGPEFRRNINLITGLLDGAGPQALKEKILEARLPDGTKFGNSPEVMKLLVGLALVQNPTGVVVPGGSGDPAPGIREELKKIADARMGNRAAYNKDTKMQERERELIGAAVKMGIMDEKGDWKK